MSTIIDFKPYRRLLFDNTNYYLLNDFGNEVELEMVRKREVGKLVKVDKLGRWVVQADNPDLETLKYVLIDNVTPVHFTLTEEGFANGADVIVVPNPIIPPDQPGTMKVKYPVEVNFDATENRHYEIKPEDPDTQVMEKVNLSVGVKKNFYLNKDEVPPELQVIIIENPDEEEGGSILHKKIIDKEVTITTNGDTTLTPDANEVYNIVKIHTMIPQSITIDPSQIPEDKTVIVVEKEEGDEPQTQIISKEWEHKEIEITENGERVVEAAEGKVLRDVTITTNVPQEVTIESSETGRKPGYDIIYVPYLDEEGHIDPSHESDPVFKKGVEKVRTITTNHSTTEITPSSNEILNKVTVKVEVPQTQEYVFGDNNIIEGHDTIVIPKTPDDTSDPTIRSVNWETVNKEFNHNIENYEITASSNEYILDKVNVKVNLPIQDKTVTITHNGETTIEPDENYSAMSSTTVNVNVQIEGNFEEKTVNITEQNQEITPSEGYDAMTKITIDKIEPSLFTDNNDFWMGAWTDSWGITTHFPHGTIYFKKDNINNVTIARVLHYEESPTATTTNKVPCQLGAYSSWESITTPFISIADNGVFDNCTDFLFAVHDDYTKIYSIWLLVSVNNDAITPVGQLLNEPLYGFVWTDGRTIHPATTTQFGIHGYQARITTTLSPQTGEVTIYDATTISSAYKNPATAPTTDDVPVGQLISASLLIDSKKHDSTSETYNRTHITIGPKPEMRASQAYNDSKIGTLVAVNGTKKFDVLEIAKGYYSVNGAIL